MKNPFKKVKDQFSRMKEISEGEGIMDSDHVAVHKPHANLSSMGRDSLIIEKLPGYFLILCILGVLVLFFYVLSPFLTVLFIAAVLAITFYSLYSWLFRLFRGHKKLSSLVSCLLVFLVIVIPLVLFVFLISVEASNTYELIKVKFESGVFDKFFEWEKGNFFYDLKQKIDPVVDLDSFDIKKNIIDAAKSASTEIASQATNILAGIGDILFSFVIMLFAMYYFFKDGPSLVKRIGRLSPLPSEYEGQLFSKIGSMVKAIMLGVFVTAIAQGLVGGIGFAIAGISNPVFWGTAMAFLSMVPVVGTAIVWVPAVIILLVLGNYGAAIFVLIWGVIVIGSVDNILRPFLIGGRAKTYPLLTFFVILGGIGVMGLKGVIVGPLVLMALMALLHIYEAEYSRVLKK